MGLPTLFFATILRLNHESTLEYMLPTEHSKRVNSDEMP